MQDKNENVNRDRAVAWTGAEVALSVLLAWWFWPLTVYAVLNGVGFEDWYYGDDAPEMAKRLRLWTDALAFPFQVLTYPLVFSAFRKTPLEQMGLTTRRFGRNFLVGVAALMMWTPVVFGIWQLIRWLYGGSAEQKTEQHALEVIAQQDLRPTEWVLLFFTAMIAAPIREELTFRGVLQPWLATRRWGGLAAMLGALVLALDYRRDRLSAAWNQGVSSLAEAASPALFVAALFPVYLVVRRLSRTSVPSAIFGTSLLFASIHTAVWPTPIPLFVLALGLGVLAQRTGSLVGPIVMHSLFNSFACVTLLVDRLK